MKKSTGKILLAELFDIGKISDINNRQFYITDLIYVSMGLNNFENKIGLTPSIANDLLGKCGIKVKIDTKELIISNNNAWIKSFFNKQGYSNHSSRLKTIAGSYPTKKQCALFRFRLIERNSNSIRKRIFYKFNRNNNSRIFLIYLQFPG